MPALQAFHEEEAFLNARMTQESLDPKALHTFDMEDMDELLENMSARCFGGKTPRTNSKQMLPPTQQMISSMPPTDFVRRSDFGGFVWELSPPSNRPPKRRRYRKTHI